MLGNYMNIAHKFGIGKKNMNYKIYKTGKIERTCTETREDNQSHLRILLSEKNYSWLERNRGEMFV